MNENIPKNYNLVIIGGGAAGIMAAISAARNHPDYDIAIIDRTFALGRKILVCGAGRCNITNKNLSSKPTNFYYGARKEFVSSIFNQFGYSSIIKFFEDLGVDLYVERKTEIGKLFPSTNQAATITELLLDELSRLNIEVFLNTECTKITKSDGFEIETKKYDLNTKEVVEGSTFHSEKLLISAGGKTYPTLGSNGTGYDLAKSLGHTIITPVPSAVSLESDNHLSGRLLGVKLDAEVTSVIDGISVKTRTDELMFTKYGFSGPVILNISREVSIAIHRDKKTNIGLNINFLPGKGPNEIREILLNRWIKRPNQAVLKSLYGLFPNKFASTILDFFKISLTKKVKDLNDAEITMLINGIAKAKFDVDGTRDWGHAEFTAGGVNTKEIKANTLESKIVPELYFCGEVLDVDGDVGGFNLSWSWASGWVAGKLQ